METIQSTSEKISKIFPKFVFQKSTPKYRDRLMCLVALFYVAWWFVVYK